MRFGSKVIDALDKVEGLDREEVAARQGVTDIFEFRLSEYYAGLIDWGDENDPLRKIVLPEVVEIADDLAFDPSNEESNTQVHGLQHKYRNTALLLVTDVCPAYCRFCFRKRFTLSTSKENHILPVSQNGVSKETSFKVEPGLRYIADHPEIDKVLVTGGDPLMLSVERLERIVQALREIPHVKVIRIGSKVPAFDPARVSDSLLDMLKNYRSSGKWIYLIAHFNHPKELTALAEQRIAAALTRGIRVDNQTPLLRDVNNNSKVLTALFKRLTECGVTPYYLFQCRPTRGNKHFFIPIQEGIEIVNEVRAGLSGLAKRFRYAGSHATGKIEVVGTTREQLVMRYHEARNLADEGRLMFWPIDKEIYWFDEVVATNRLGMNSPG